MGVRGARAERSVERLALHVCRKAWALVPHLAHSRSGGSRPTTRTWEMADTVHPERELDLASFSLHNTWLTGSDSSQQPERVRALDLEVEESPSRAGARPALLLPQAHSWCELHFPDNAALRETLFPRSRGLRPLPHDSCVHGAHRDGCPRLT
ncbi:hypothetical protein AB1E18_019647 [Capra hircus]